MLIIVNENQLDEWVRANAREAQGLIVEHAGYPRLAHTLRELADAYDREAEAIIRKYARED